MTAPVVVDSCGGHLHAADLDTFAGPHFDDLFESGPSQQSAAAAGREHRAGPELSQRRHVQMIEVRVRDQHGVRVVEAIELRRGNDAPEMLDSRAQHGVGQEPRSGRLHLDRRVA